MSIPKPKKMVSTNAAIGLGTICTILAVLLVATTIVYTSDIKVKENVISSLESQKTEKDSEISTLNNQITNLQEQIDDLDAITHIAKSSVWENDIVISQPANSYWSMLTNRATYAGYISVTVESSTSPETYVRLNYSLYVTTSVVDGHAHVTALSYDNQISVGSAGTAVFPVLPALTSGIQIRVGNTNLIDGATETVTITYYY